MDAIQRLETGTIFLIQGIIGYIQGYHNGHKLSGVGGEVQLTPHLDREPRDPGTCWGCA